MISYFLNEIWNQNAEPSHARCAESCGWGGFWTFPRWKSRVFLKSDLTEPPSDFWCASFGKYQFKPFQLSVDFYINMMFSVRFESEIFCATGVWGLISLDSSKHKLSPRRRGMIMWLFRHRFLTKISLKPLLYLILNKIFYSTSVSISI